MRFGFPILTVSTGALVIAGGFALATAGSGVGTTVARPVAFAAPAEPAPVTPVGPARLGVTPAAADPAVRAVLRTRSDALPASWWVRASGPAAAAR